MAKPTMANFKAVQIISNTFFLAVNIPDKKQFKAQIFMANAVFASLLLQTGQKTN